MICCRIKPFIKLIPMLCGAHFLMVGCAFYVPPVWDLGDAKNKANLIKERETTRSEIIDKLGEPSRECGMRCIEYTGSSSAGLLLPGRPAADFIEVLDETRWCMHIFFENEVVDFYEIITTDVSIRCSRDRIKDPRLAKPQQTWADMCRKAVNGDGRYRYELAQHYQFGKPPVSRDVITALMWFELANKAGFQQAGNWQNQIAKYADESDVLEAHRRAVAFVPGAIHCEIGSEVVN